jgi:hypothetical protein
MDYLELEETLDEFSSIFRVYCNFTNEAHATQEAALKYAQYIKHVLLKEEISTPFDKR